MCSSKPNLQSSMIAEKIARINGRPVLQPTSNQTPNLDRRNSLKKASLKSIPSNKTLKPGSSPSSPISPKSKTPVTKIGNAITKSSEKALSKPKQGIQTLKKSKSCVGGDFTGKDSSLLKIKKPGSIAAARRDEIAVMQEQRKMKIAHYGRTKSAKVYQKRRDSFDSSSTVSTNVEEGDKKRCSFITPNSDPLYVAYHDEEWGVPVHDDKLLFELLVLTVAQVGSDWTSVLKQRQNFREAFCGFEAELVAKFNEKRIYSITADYGIHLSQVLAAVDNSKQILKVKQQYGSFEKYLWGFINHRSVMTQHRSYQKIPVKTSKSESISKDMIRRGFRYVGPMILYSFMQAAGLTNDHLVTCPRHLHCLAAVAQLPVPVENAAVRLLDAARLYH